MLSSLTALVNLERESLVDLIYGSANIPFSHRHVLKPQWKPSFPVCLLTAVALSPSLVQGIAVPRMSTSGIQLTGGGNNPKQLGQLIAQSVYEGIGHE